MGFRRAGFLRDGGTDSVAMMEGGLGTRRSRMLARRCVACGQAVPATGSLLPACLACGCDFHERPPRSYAEMEGLVPLVEMEPAAASLLDRSPTDVGGHEPKDDRGDLNVARVRRRWAIVVLAMIAVATTLLVLVTHAAS